MSTILPGITFMNQDTATKFDEALMANGMFSVDQLMELAGLSVASAIEDFYSKKVTSDVLVVCGPGNNGGDGLVAARHLTHFGFKNVSIVYPKATAKTLYLSLMNQAAACGIPIIQDLPEFLGVDAPRTSTSILVDAIFGFSFSGAIREPFASIIKRVKQSHVRTIAVDIPSGWDVNDGNISGEGMDAEMLVSLTLPKLGSREFKGAHYLGGRFVPCKLAEEFKLEFPQYEGSKQFVRLDR